MKWPVRLCVRVDIILIDYHQQDKDHQPSDQNGFKYERLMIWKTIQMK